MTEWGDHLTALLDGAVVSDNIDELLDAVAGQLAELGMDAAVATFFAAAVADSAASLKPARHLSPRQSRIIEALTYFLVGLRAGANPRPIEIPDAPPGDPQ